MATAEITAFERLQIQMEYVVPLVRRLQEILGEDVINDALAERNRRDLADAIANFPPDRDRNCLRVRRGIEHFAKGGVLDIEFAEESEESAAFNVTRCDYTIMMEKLGARDIGQLLLCDTDFASCEADGYSLTRTQTCMGGASHCDFRFKA